MDAGKDTLYDKLFLAGKPEPAGLSAGAGAQTAKVLWSNDELSSLASLIKQGLALLRDARVQRR